MAILQKKCSPRPIPAAKRRSLGEGSKAKQTEGRRFGDFGNVIDLVALSGNSNRVGFAEIREGFRTKFEDKAYLNGGYGLFVVDELEVFGLAKWRRISHNLCFFKYVLLLVEWNKETCKELKQSGTQYFLVVNIPSKYVAVSDWFPAANPLCLCLCLSAHHIRKMRVLYHWCDSILVWKRIDRW